MKIALWDNDLSDDRIFAKIIRIELIDLFRGFEIEVRTENEFKLNNTFKIALSHELIEALMIFVENCEMHFPYQDNLLSEIISICGHINSFYADQLWDKVRLGQQDDD